MADGSVCGCAACRVRAVCWPVMLIAAGSLLSLDLVWHAWPIWKTWPVLLIVWGVCRLAERLAPDTGHGGARPAQVSLEQRLYGPFQE